MQANRLIIRWRGLYAKKVAQGTNPTIFPHFRAGESVFTPGFFRYAEQHYFLRLRDAEAPTPGT